MDGAEHLTRDFFRRILEADSVKSLYLSDGCSGGDNFSSKVYRAVVNYKKNSCKETTSFIVKCISYEGERAFLATMDIYGAEVRFYKEMLPKMELILKEKIAPQFYFNSEDPIRTIVIEDLAEKGYEIADRLKGLNFEQSKLVIRKLASFHASSAIVAQMYPELVEKFKTHMFHNLGEHKIVVEEMFLKNVDYLIELVGNWENFTSIALKLRKFRENFIHYAEAAVSRDSNPFNVINHGDCWVNNFMFKRDVDVLFVSSID